MIPLNLSAALAGRKKFVEANDDNTAAGGSGSGTGSLMQLRTANDTGMVFSEKSPTGFTGLINQGATCYLNSLLQSLYSIPEFKSALFQSSFLSSDDTVNLCRQLQKLFTELDYTARGAISTNALTKSFGWSSRESFQQQDVQECMTVIFEFIKASYPTSAIAQWLDTSWNGEILSSLVCHNCQIARSKRSEKYRDLQLQVKGMNSLTTSLQSYFQDEELEGVECEHCNGRYTHSQKKCLNGAVLPEVLTIQLRRFDMDWNTFQRIKVYDPLDIDRTLTIDSSILDSQLSTIPTYELTSVMMHSGSAFAGHYFCYIKANQGKWLLFNDSSVTALEESEVEAIFAPSEVVSSEVTEVKMKTDDEMTAESNHKKMLKKKMLLPVNRHAYMVVYRRVHDDAALATTQLDPPESSVARRERCTQNPPEDLIAAVREDNDRYLAAKQKYETEREFLHITVHRNLPHDNDTKAKIVSSPDDGLQGNSKEVDTSMSVFRIHQSKTLNDLTDMVHESFYTLDNDSNEFSKAVARDQIRLRAFDLIKDTKLPATQFCPLLADPTKQASLSQIEAEAGSVLKDIDENRFQKYIYVEVNHDGSSPFSPLVDGDYDKKESVILDNALESTTESIPVQIHLKRFIHTELCGHDNANEDSIWELISNKLSLSLSSYAQLQDNVYAALLRDFHNKHNVKVDTDFPDIGRLVMAMLIKGNVSRDRASSKEQHRVLNLSENFDDAVLAVREDNNASNNLVVYVDFQSDAEESVSCTAVTPTMLNHLEAIVHCVNIQVTALDIHAKTQREMLMKMDMRDTLSDVKTKISEECGWKIPSFRIISDMTEKAHEIKDMSTVLSTLVTKNQLIQPDSSSELNDLAVGVDLKDLPPFNLPLYVENVSSMAIGDLRVALFLKQSPSSHGLQESIGGESDEYIPLLSAENSNNEFIFHQNDLIRDIKRRIIGVHGSYLQQTKSTDTSTRTIPSFENQYIRLQLLVQKSTPPKESESASTESIEPPSLSQKATLPLSDQLTFAQCLQSKSGSLIEISTDALCVTIEDVHESSFHRDTDMLLALWEWIPVACRKTNEVVNPLRKVIEIVVPQSVTFGDIKDILHRKGLEDATKKRDNEDCSSSTGDVVEGEQTYFAKPFLWQMRTNPEENIPQLKWTNQPESDASLLMEAPLRLQTNNRSKHMMPPVLLFKRCLSSQLDEAPTGIDSDTNDLSTSQASGASKGKKSRYVQPEAGGFRLYTPEEQAARQLEDMQLQADRERALAAMTTDHSTLVKNTKISE